MNHIERFISTIERKPVDRPATWLGLPTVAAYDELFSYFGVSNVLELSLKLDDDVIPIEMPYHSPSADAIHMALDFSNHGKLDNEERTLGEHGFFEGVEDPARIDDFDWPDPSKYIDPDLCRKMVDELPDDRAIMGILWSSHFQDTNAAFGMEEAMMMMYDSPEMYHAVINRCTDFYFEANRIFYEAVAERIHAVLIGNDMGSQQGLMVSPELLHEFVTPCNIRLIEQAKSYGLKVVYHSCGAVSNIIPDLIDSGVDVIHPIQALAAGMEPQGLKDTFGERVSFCGGVDAQNLLVNGTPEEVAAKVNELKSIFPTGLIISPSHEAILPDIPPANIEALLSAAKEDG
ncbi:uroporphyrinogen decarboxylase family protein [Pontiellaceae bacterium B12227]|nr:uroporphyrinogen decarboxylase family protein [Pontiellaceae bacterium B12227]